MSTNTQERAFFEVNQANMLPTSVVLSRKIPAGTRLGDDVSSQHAADLTDSHVLGACRTGGERVRGSARPAPASLLLVSHIQDGLHRHPHVRLQQLHGQVDAADREVGQEELLQLAHSSCRRPRHCLRPPSARTNSRESPLPQPEAASCLHRGSYAHVLLGEENAICCCISSLPRSGTWRVVVQDTLYSLKCHISHEVNNLHEGLKHVLHPPLVEE